MNNQFAIRLDDRNGYLEILKELMKNIRFSKHLCVKHYGKTGENIHYHICLTTDYKNQALRKEFKRLFVLGKGNGHMSLKEWDGDEKALSYMFHEDEHEIITTNYNDDDIEKFKISNSDIQKKLKDNGANGIVCKAVAAIREKGFHSTHESICNTIWDILKENGEWFPNKFQLERWVMKVQAELAGDSHSWQKCKDNWYRQMFNH